MTNEEKIKEIKFVIDNNPNTEKEYYRLLENIGGLKGNYGDYMIIKS